MSQPKGPISALGQAFTDRRDDGAPSTPGMNDCVNENLPLSEAEVSSIIGMAWSDDTPFEAIALQFGLNESEVIALMRDQLKTRSFRVWRMRVRGRAAKHGGRQKFDLQSQIHASHPRVQSMARDTLEAADFPAPNTPLTSTSLL